MIGVKGGRGSARERGVGRQARSGTTTAGPTAYDVAGHYDDRYFDDLADRYTRRNRFARRRIANVLKLLPDVTGRRLIDLGCGMGTFTIETARRGAAAVGVDPAAAALDVARRVAAAETVAGARFVRADAAALPVASGKADIVLAADLAEHLDDGTFRLVLAEARRALGEDGVLVVYTPDGSHLLERLRSAGVLRQDPSHIAVRSAAELRTRIREAGFEPVRVIAQPSHLPGLNWLERLLGPWVPLLRRRIGLVARRSR